MVRLSGRLSISILKALFRSRGSRSPWNYPRLLVQGEILDGKERVLDFGMAVWFKAPASFTGEQVVEIHCHGSGGVIRSLKGACEAMGARPALPGEFSFRAVLNGKMSVMQAEAVNALVDSETALQAGSVSGIVAGRTGERMQGLRQKLLALQADMDARLDFPEDTAAYRPSDDVARMRELEDEMGAVLSDAVRGRSLREGWRIALCGAPNVGKSSLFNAFLQRDRAIVSPHPGTTRDLLEETLDLGGYPVVLIDTAGVRKSEDPVEKLGVERGLGAARNAEGVLLLFDMTAGWGDGEQSLLRQVGEKVIALVGTKADLVNETYGAVPDREFCAVSSLDGKGLDAVARRVASWAEERSPREETELVSERQTASLREATGFLREARAAIEAGQTEEAAVPRLHRAQEAMDALLGHMSPEALYDEIFSRFCIGK